MSFAVGVERCAGGMRYEGGRVGSEVIFLVPYVVGLVVAAILVGTLLTRLVWSGLRRWGPRSLREASTPFPTGVVASVLLCISLPAACVWACQPVTQPESLRTVAAFEVPLSTSAERTEFLGILRAEASAEGLHMDAHTDTDLDRGAQGFPTVETVVAAQIWRGKRAYDENEANILHTKGADYLWISFNRGEDPALAQQFRARVMRKVFERWPDTQAVPVTEGGALPLRRNLILGPKGYEIIPTS